MIRHFIRYYLWIIVLFTVIFPLLIVGTLGLRGQITPYRPWHIFLDMKYQPRYVAQGQSAFFADGRSMREPVAGTVPFSGSDYAGDAGHLVADDSIAQLDDEVYRAKDASGKFVEYIPEKVIQHFGGWTPMLARGRDRYNVHCAVCHGQAGDGGGIIKKYGANWGLIPASYHQERLRQMMLQKEPGKPEEYNPDGADGHLYNVITNGKNTMKPYGHQVKPLDRWAVVAWVRVLQRSHVATIDDLSGTTRTELEKK